MSKQLRFGFGGGEISEELWSRLDLNKYPVGVKRAENYLILPHGPALNRAGSVYNLQARENTDNGVRGITFQSSQAGGQDFFVEVGPGYMRFHVAGGGTITKPTIAGATVVPATQGKISYTGGTANTIPVAGDWVVFTAVSNSTGPDTTIGKRRLLNRWVKVLTAVANDFFIFQDLRDQDINTTAITGTTVTFARAYQITTSYALADLFELVFTQKHDVMTITHPNYPPRELRYNPIADPANPFTLVDITFQPTIGTPGAPSTVTHVGDSVGFPVAHFYRVTALREGTLEESLPSPASSSNADLTIAGTYITIVPQTVAGAVRYNVYKLRNGLYGFLAQTEGGEVRDDNVAPDMSKTIPYPSTPFSASPAGNWPSVCYHYQGRRLFAATNNLPQNFWLTVSGTISNLSYSIPTRDDDSIASAIDGDQVHRIRHAVQLGDLVFLTQAGEWALRTPNDEVLTPNNAFPRQNAAEGASNKLRPVTLGSTVVYGAASQRRLNKLEYSWQKNAYVVEDISILAPHLFDDNRLVDLTATTTPYKFVWTVRNDGKLLGLTYHPEHEVKAWHRHSTQGLYRACTKLRNGSDDELWTVVRRSLNGGGTYWNYIEFFAQRRFGDALSPPPTAPNPTTYGVFFVDSGIDATIYALTQVIET